MSWRKRWWAEGQRVSCGRWGSALRQGIRTKKEAACSVLASAPFPGVNRWVLETQRSQAWIPAWTQIIITRGKGTRLTWGKEHGVLEPRRGAEITEGPAVQAAYSLGHHVETLALPRGPACGCLIHTVLAKTILPIQSRTLLLASQQRPREAGPTRSQRSSWQCLG